MEEKIKELIDKSLEFNHDFEDVLSMSAKDALIDQLKDLFEQEKQAYAKEMCDRAYQAGYNKGSAEISAIYSLYMTKEEWLKENFPEK